MRFALELLLLVAGVGAAGYFVDRYIRARHTRVHTKSVYFSGGSLDGTRKSLPELPKTITHDDEIYRRDHVGPSEAIYVYVGTVNDPEAISYEV